MLWTQSADTDISTKLYYKYSGTAPTSATCVTMSSDINAFVASDLIGEFNTATIFRGCKVTDLTSSSAGSGLTTVSTTGTRSAGDLPASVCALLNLTIGRRYRGGKPRLYLPFGGASDVSTEQTWSNGAITAFNAAWTTFIGHLNGLSVSGTALSQQINVSYYNGFTSVENPTTHRWRNVPTLRSTPLQDTITSFAFNPKFGSQRRRNLHQA